MDDPTRTQLLAVGLAAALTVGAGGAWLGLVALDGPAAASGAADGHDHDAHGHAEDHYWLPERSADGEVPTLEEALTSLDRLGWVRITGNGEFTPDHGIAAGSGTPDDPYLIAGVYAQRLEIDNTDAWFEIKNSYIEDLHLNWNDQHAWVHHNRIGDLRVNENDPRTGNATGGVIEMNVIDHVGQIRHFDGVFRDNVVGDDSLQSPSWDDAFDALQPAINIDGYVNAVFRDNTIFGEVLVDLHGHGHASCRATCMPHNHYASMNGSARQMEHDDYDPDDYEDLPKFGGHDHPHDHSERFHTIHLVGNVIEDPDGRGLYIEDRNHDADDRTASSEPDPALMGDHWHDVLIVVEGNTLRGAGIEVDVMVAEDMYHVAGGGVDIRILDNVVEAGVLPIVDLHEVRNATVTVRGNTLSYADDQLHRWGVLERTWDTWSSSEGIRLHEFEQSEVRIEGNTISDVDRGVAARHLPTGVVWSVTDNVFVSVQTPVWWDDTVAHEPVREDNTQQEA